MDDRHAAAFRRFAEQECRGYCPFYEGLSLRIAGAPEVLSLLRDATPGQKLPNLLLGAVRFLLLSGEEHPLGRHYERAAAGGTGPGAPDPWPDFRAFCLERREAVEAQVRVRRVQTNEVGRCAALHPALSLLAREVPGLPLALVEFGCSAGLLLLADRYGYRYRAPGGAEARRGVPGAEVLVECELRAGDPGDLPAAGPQVAARVGLDLDPVDLRDPDRALWLRALVWPDQPRREERLLRAAEAARRERLDLRAGDGVALLPAALEGLPAGTLPVVLNAAACFLLGPGARAAFERALLDASARRPLGRVSMESGDGRTSALEVSLLRDGEVRSVHASRAHPHGAWLEWGRA
jgi:hypothetical protein